MEKIKFELFESKSLKVFFDDGERVRFKIGRIIATDDAFVYMSTSSGPEALAQIRIVRIELDREVNSNG